MEEVRMKNLNQKLAVALASLTLAACGGGGSAGGAGGFGVPNKATITSTDKALFMSKGATASGLQKSSNSALSSLSDDLVKMDLNGDLTEVTFMQSQTMPDNSVVETEVTFSVGEVIQLSSQWVVLVPTLGQGAGMLLLLDKDTGNIFNIIYLEKQSLQIHDGYLYGITTGSYYRLDTGALSPYTLMRINLATQEQEKVLLHDADETTSDGAIYTQFQYAWGYYTLSPASSTGTVANPLQRTAMVIGDNFIFAKAYGVGPNTSGHNSYAGTSILIRDGQQAMNCSIDIDFASTGGGFGGGILRSPNGTLYTIRIVNSQMAADVGESLVRVVVESDMNTFGCYSAQNPANLVVRLQDMGGSHFPEDYNQLIAPANTNYTMNSFERYYLSPTGFLRTADDGSGGLTMTWTNLNLSALPRSSGGNSTVNTVFIEGNQVYYRVGRDISVQTLQGGSTASAFHTASEDILNFSVVGTDVLYSTASGTYKVSGAGQPAEFVSETPLVSAARF
jgi:hypothetical protein